MRSTANHRTGGKRSPAIRPVPPSTRQHSAAWGLALFYACLIVYASLYPFAPWSSNGLPWWGFVSHPWPRYWTGFDITANLLDTESWTSGGGVYGGTVVDCILSGNAAANGGSVCAANAIMDV